MGMCQTFQGRAEDGHCGRTKNMDKTLPHNLEGDLHGVAGKLVGQSYMGDEAAKVMWAGGGEGSGRVGQERWHAGLRL